MSDKPSIAERLDVISLRMQSPHNAELWAATEELREVVISLEPITSAEDALALQCLALDLARILAEGIVSEDKNGRIMDLMRCAMVRAGYFLETASGRNMVHKGFFDFHAPAPVIN